MDKLIIEGSARLVGEVETSGAKNSALPLMAATLLCKGTHQLRNVPHLKDIETFKKLLTHHGSKIEENSGILTFESSAIDNLEAPYDLVKTMRAAILVLGPLAGRFKEARVSLPGGCAIGERPVNLHIEALEKMGAEIEITDGYINLKTTGLKGAHLYFENQTVTGTENLMLAAVLAKGTTTIENAALEP
ncbi:MAG: UDP-N-acetylglucosamine 1-carboxyvinyltransferase, partial [Deltaproteobacteria bacterium]|nr:UDP-N-acetylglucosamine 1-carboxyvinyltransferase [Deltaproteobacteria bacterium]